MPDDERAEFRASVEAACRDLSAPQRAKIIEAVDAWLAERGAAESGGGVALALGDAEAYAAELRAAMGLPERPVAVGRSDRVGRLPRWVLAVVVVVLLLVGASVTTWAVTRSNGSDNGRPTGSGNAASAPPVAVPNVVSMTAQAAARELRKAGLRTLLQFVVAPVKLGQVVVQGPAAGARVPRGSVVEIKVASTYAEAGTLPPCRPLPGRPADTVRIVMHNASNLFTQDCYHAPANTAFHLEVTDRAFAIANHELTPVQLVISLQSHPAIRPVPGRPGFAAGSTKGAAFVSDQVTTSRTRTFVVPPLSAGRYAVQNLPGFAVATLVVQ